MINTVNKTEKGFTLVELLVSLGLFTVVMTISLGTVLAIFEANRKTESLRKAIDNANFAMEIMVKEIKFAKDISYNDNELSFTMPDGSENGRDISYQLDNGTLNKKIEDFAGGEYLPMISTSYEITDFDVHIDGITEGDDRQPLVTIYLKGAVQTRDGQSEFSLQGSASSRQLDF